MTGRRVGVAIVVVSAVAYLLGFATDHLVDYDSASASTQRVIELGWDASTLLPLIGVGVAVYLWPRWWVVAAISAVMFVWPFGVHELEIATGLRPRLGDGCDPCVDTTFLAVLALPALLIGTATLAVARWRLGKRARPSQQAAA